MGMCGYAGLQTAEGGLRGDNFYGDGRCHRLRDVAS